MSYAQVSYGAGRDRQVAAVAAPRLGLKLPSGTGRLAAPDRGQDRFQLAAGTANRSIAAARCLMLTDRLRERERALANQ